MKKSVYMIIDIVIFTALVCLAETANIFAYKALNGLFSISIILPLTLIVMFRWKYPAAITAVCGTLVFCAVIMLPGELYAVYLAGNLFVMANLAWFRFLKSSRIVKSIWLTGAFVLTAYLLMAVGKTIMSLFFGWSFLPSFIKFVSVDAINLANALIIIMIARRQKGLVENQRDYLIRIAEESKEGGV